MNREDWACVGIVLLAVVYFAAYIGLWILG